MRIADAKIHFYNLQRFTYRSGDSRHTRIAHSKSQYVYRFLFVSAGRLDFELCGETCRLTAGDLIFLVPGDEYRIIPCGQDFTLLNLYFDFSGDGRGASGSCVFMEGFRRELCPAPTAFSDTELFGRSRKFDGAGLTPIFTELAEADASDSHFPLLARAKLAEAFYLLIRMNGGREVYGPADEIIAYINTNPTADLSAEALERRFGYHRNHINRLLRTRTGRTLTECVRRSKIAYALAAVGEAGTPLTEIAAELGYYDYSHFYKAFEREIGVSPGEYRDGA